jgi:flavodoxin
LGTGTRRAISLLQLDRITTRTGEKMEKIEQSPGDPLPVKALLVVFSYHHKNTEKIAHVFGKVLDAEIKTPEQVTPEELQGYDLVGFGSGIYSGQHHEGLLLLAGRLPQITDRKAFIFSTGGIPERFWNEAYVAKNHSALREKLQAKGYIIVDEFSCPGFNTNSFLTLFGGINKGRPNAEDLRHAEEFARNLLENVRDS